ncbi:hypothetical protein SARC_11070 [Sphaeroforma arctica JP610]|uniref:CCHC-type domain-containing protein n=1 Tax=Sphaeroforma arctica JP610 TaxID=667725 RepID=A0A0L0FI47_9EUKA|nr:hypothetical protein SARC_11070 [Sphaeroforma arctica JP610]KNC76430.1 hypothetical protein SARC_11070 [Sphaeroforma arctica JP610]|eukprot:XP_014150332.1 hypothetical protein SARC_11070 [Sphaeroforma arctica JP610]
MRTRRTRAAAAAEQVAVVKEPTPEPEPEVEVETEAVEETKVVEEVKAQAKDPTDAKGAADADAADTKEKDTVVASVEEEQVDEDEVVGELTDDGEDANDLHEAGKVKDTEAVAEPAIDTVQEDAGIVAGDDDKNTNLTERSSLMDTYAEGAKSADANAEPQEDTTAIEVEGVAMNEREGEMKVDEDVAKAGETEEMKVDGDATNTGETKEMDAGGVTTNAGETKEMEVDVKQDTVVVETTTTTTDVVSNDSSGAEAVEKKVVVETVTETVVADGEVKVDATEKTVNDEAVTDVAEVKVEAVTDGGTDTVGSIGVVSGGVKREEPTAAPTEREERRKRKKRSRWGGEEEKTVTAGVSLNIPSGMTAAQQETYILHLNIEEVNKRLRSEDLGIPSDVSKRSPSPEPIYDQYGKRLNTREQRTKTKLEEDRHNLIQKILEVNPEYRPPADYKPVPKRYQDRVDIPQEENPHVNFIGLLIGPRGNTLKKMERDSGAKIMIRGKGSVKEGKGRRDGAPIPGENEQLHAMITGPDAIVVKKGTDLVQNIIKVGIETPDSANELKSLQLRELAALNGTLREDLAQNCSNCGATDHRHWQCTERRNAVQTIVCSVCGGHGHIGKDCAQREIGGVPQKQSGENIDNEYLSFMAELEGGGGKAPAPAVEPGSRPALMDGPSQQGTSDAGRDHQSHNQNNNYSNNHGPSSNDGAARGSRPGPLLSAPGGARPVGQGGLVGQPPGRRVPPSGGLLDGPPPQRNSGAQPGGRNPWDREAPHDRARAPWENNGPPRDRQNGPPPPQGGNSRAPWESSGPNRPGANDRYNSRSNGSSDNHSRQPWDRPAPSQAPLLSGNKPPWDTNASVAPPGGRQPWDAKPNDSYNSHTNTTNNSNINSNHNNYNNGMNSGPPPPPPHSSAPPPPQQPPPPPPPSNNQPPPPPSDGIRPPWEAPSQQPPPPPAQNMNQNQNRGGAPQQGATGQRLPWEQPQMPPGGPPASAYGGGHVPGQYNQSQSQYAGQHQPPPPPPPSAGQNAAWNRGPPGQQPWAQNSQVPQQGNLGYGAMSQQPPLPWQQQQQPPPPPPPPQSYGQPPPPPPPSSY